MWTSKTFTSLLLDAHFTSKASLHPAASDGDAGHSAADVPKMEDGKRSGMVRKVFNVKNYHRALKQCCIVEWAQARSAKSQKCHIVSSLRTLVRFEARR